jgi:hypothetical protein
MRSRQAVVPISPVIRQTGLVQKLFVAVEKLDLSENRPKRSDQKCIGDRRKSFIGHPDATHFRRKFCERVFQQLPFFPARNSSTCVNGFAAEAYLCQKDVSNNIEPRVFALGDLGVARKNGIERTFGSPRKEADYSRTLAHSS